MHPQVVNMQWNTIYQQKGAPPYWNSHVQETLMTIIPYNWFGHNGPNLAPAFVSINPLDFLLWRYAKDRVYVTHVPDLPTLQDRIHDVINSVTPDMFSRKWQEIEYRLDIICATSGTVEVH
jgi:hypothetical protein